MPMTSSEFAASIKAKYPQYKDMPDADLVSAMVTKYPQYKEQIQDGSSSLPDKYRGVAPPDDTPEPDTYWGGFMKSLKDQARKAFLENPLMKGAAHPQGVGDVLSLLIPSEMAMGTGIGGATRELAGAGAEAAAGQKGLRKIPAMIKGMWQQTENPVYRSEIDHNFSVKTQGGVPAITDAASTERVPYTPQTAYDKTPPPRLAGKAPTLDEVLQDALVEARQPEAVTKTTAAEPPTSTAGGPFKQSASPKANKKNIGGYSSGTPSVTQEGYDEIASNPLNVSGRSLPSEGEGVPPEEIPAGDVVEPPAKPKLSAEEVAQALRRMYGSRDAGKMLQPNQPASVGAEQIKRLAPGPSRTPLAAEARIQAASSGQGSSLDDMLAEMLAQIRSSNPPVEPR